MSYNVTQLPAYVEQNKSELLSAAILSPTTIEDFTWMSGVHSPTTLNLMNNSLTFQNGSTCGFNPTDTTELTQRTLTPGVIKVNATWCGLDVINTYATHMIAMGAGKESMPFEQKIMADYTINLKNELERAIWQSNKATGSGNLSFFDGIMAILDAASALTTNVTFDASDTAKDKIEKVFLAIPEKVLDKAVIYVSPALFRQYVTELVAVNLFHYTPEIDPSREVIIPGTQTKVKMAMGLTGSGNIYAFDPKNCVYGFDAEGDYTNYKLWYDDTDEVYKMIIRFSAGVQFAFPQYVTVGK